MNRGKRPKLPPFEISKLENCDRPLGKNERKEMSAERQWGTVGVMGLMEKVPTTEVRDGGVMMTVTESPKHPPPQAPTYASDPIGGSQNLLGGKENEGDSKGKDSKGGRKGKDPEGDHKGKTPKEITKEKIPKEKGGKERKVQNG